MYKRQLRPFGWAAAERRRAAAAARQKALERAARAARRAKAKAAQSGTAAPPPAFVLDRERVVWVRYLAVRKKGPRPAAHDWWPVPASSHLAASTLPGSTCKEASNQSNRCSNQSTTETDKLNNGNQGPAVSL